MPARPVVPGARPGVRARLPAAVGPSRSRLLRRGRCRPGRPGSEAASACRHTDRTRQVSNACVSVELLILVFATVLIAFLLSQVGPTHSVGRCARFRPRPVEPGPGTSLSRYRVIVDANDGERYGRTLVPVSGRRLDQAAHPRLVPRHEGPSVQFARRRPSPPRVPVRDDGRVLPAVRNRRSASPRAPVHARGPESVMRRGRSRYRVSGAANPNWRYRPCASAVCSIQRYPAPGPSSIIACTMALPSPAPR